MPLALAEVEAAAGHDRYRENVARGLDWVFGNNELGTPLVDEGLGVIWRGVEPSPEGLRIIREMHSYHPARCLYRLARR